MKSLYVWSLGNISQKEEESKLYCLQEFYCKKLGTLGVLCTGLGRVHIARDSSMCHLDIGFQDLFWCENWVLFLSSLGWCDAIPSSWCEELEYPHAASLI